jgi:hypothetical protein
VSQSIVSTTESIVLPPSAPPPTPPATPPATPPGTTPSGPIQQQSQTTSLAGSNGS